MIIVGVQNERTKQIQHVFLSENMEEAIQGIKVSMAKKMPLEAEVEGLTLVALGNPDNMPVGDTEQIIEILRSINR